MLVCHGLILSLLCCETQPSLNDQIHHSTSAAEQAPIVNAVFVDRTEAVGIDFRHESGARTKNYIVEAKGGGAAFFDSNRDGFLDIYLVNGGHLKRGTEPLTNALYRNDEGRRFDDISHVAGVADRGWGMGCVAADYDGDGEVDLYVTNFGANRLYRNDASGAFQEVGKRAGVDLSGWSSGASFGDVDGDGDLDLYVAQYVDFRQEEAPPRSGMWKGMLVFAGPVGLPAAMDELYLNAGDGTFTQATAASGMRTEKASYGLGVLCADFDSDGDRDVFVANDSEANFFFRNDGRGVFREEALTARVALSGEGRVQAGMGVAYGDYDNDGQMDFLATHFEDDYNTLYHNSGDGTFHAASFEQGLVAPSQPRLGFGAVFLDHDNDGDRDLAVANGHVYPQIKHLRSDGYAEPNQLFVNGGAAVDWRFVGTDAGDLGLPNVSRGMCRGDYDNDGDQDLLVTNLDGRPALLENQVFQGNHWFGVRLVGTDGNSQGIGARVRLVAGELEIEEEIITGGSFLSHSDTRAHFGLGFRSRIDSLRVTWPDGHIQKLYRLPVDQYLTVVKPGK